MEGILGVLLHPKVSIHASGHRFSQSGILELEPGTLSENQPKYTLDLTLEWLKPNMS